MTTTRAALRALFQAIEDEAAGNPAFSARLGAALQGLAVDVSTAAPPRPAKAKARRAPAVLDPVSLARRGEPALREALGGLGVEQLKDIIAEHGLDPGKLTARWRTPDRLIGHIVVLALSRARKGEAFR